MTVIADATGRLVARKVTGVVEVERIRVPSVANRPGDLRSLLSSGVRAKSHRSKA